MCHEIRLEEDVPEQYWEAANALPSPLTRPLVFGNKKGIRARLIPTHDLG